MASSIFKTRRAGWLAVLLPAATLFADGRGTVRPPVPETYAGELGDAPANWSPERAALGKRLFFDTVLSHDRSVSCASCHQPERAFTDGRKTAQGITLKAGARNTPTILNRALGVSQFWDGRSQTLEEQALGPIANPDEMGLAVDLALVRLQQDASYRDAFARAFGGGPTAARLAEALAAYERTVYSVDSPFDRFIAGDESALSASAQRGLAIFGGKAKCGECHVGPNFTDEGFYSLGVGTDGGRERVTTRPQDRGAFKTPTLREIARTAPYMHDGSLATLAEVVDYYDRGCVPHPNLPAKIHELQLTPQEKADLVAFLEALSGKIVDSPATTVAVQE
jgi:cytochrome c peroxidase